MFCSLTVKLFEVAFCRMFRVGNKQCVAILRKVVHEGCSVKAGAVSDAWHLILKFGCVLSGSSSWICFWYSTLSTQINKQNLNNNKKIQKLIDNCQIERTNTPIRNAFVAGQSTNYWNWTQKEHPSLQRHSFGNQFRWSLSDSKHAIQSIHTASATEVTGHRSSPLRLSVRHTMCHSF